MTDYRKEFDALVNDPRYLRNLDWGKPRAGHPEGTIRAHIAELETNLEKLRARLSEEEFWKLKLLIHVHDICKPDAAAGVAIKDPRSHASQARTLLAKYVDDDNLLVMVQFHDEPYALYQQFKRRGEFDRGRLEALLATIRDWDLFLAFLIVDGGTPGKSPRSLQWFCDQLAEGTDRRIADHFKALMALAK